MRYTLLSILLSSGAVAAKAGGYSLGKRQLACESDYYLCTAPVSQGMELCCRNDLRCRVNDDDIPYCYDPNTTYYVFVDGTEGILSEQADTFTSIATDDDEVTTTVTASATSGTTVTTTTSATSTTTASPSTTTTSSSSTTTTTSPTTTTAPPTPVTVATVTSTALAPRLGSSEDLVARLAVGAVALMAGGLL